jgi:hypothetical protein
VEGKVTDENDYEWAWERINRNLQGDKPNRWIKLSDAVRLIAQALKVMPSVARAELHTQALPPAVPWAAWTTVAVVNGIDKKGVIEINRSSLIGARFDFHNYIIWADGGYELRYDDTYVEQNHLEAWLEEKRSEPVVEPVPSPPENLDFDWARWAAELDLAIEASIRAQRQRSEPVVEPVPASPEARSEPNGEPTKQKQTRQTNPEDDADTKRKIEAVIARWQRWPKDKQKLRERQQAELLAYELSKSVGYGVSTMRAILRGEYPAMIRLGISKPK